MLKPYNESPITIGMVAVGIVLLLIGGIAGFVLSKNQNTILTESDKEFIAGLVGTGIVQYSDRLCEKNGLRPDLLPQIATITDQNGQPVRQVQYFVPVCVA